MPRILICAATGTESSAARAGIRRAGLEGRFDFLKTGIGLKKAAAALDRHLSAIGPREYPERIISTGFAGSWSSDLSVGEWIQARAVFDETGESFEQVLKDGLSTRAAAIISTETIHPAAPQGVIKKMRERLGAKDLPCAVDMESFALAAIAQKYRIPFSSIRFVTDSAGDPLPEFVRHFTHAAVDAQTKTRAKALLDGAASLVRRPAEAAKFLRNGALWRNQLIAGWSRIAQKYH